MCEQEPKNKGTGNKKMMEESVKRQGVSNSSSSGSDDFNLHFTPGKSEWQPFIRSLIWIFI